MLSIKFPLFFILFYFVGRSFPQSLEDLPKCAITQPFNLLSITTSPGFLSGALPYVGHHECTETGTCKNIPFICPTSSCCISNRNISLPTGLTNSHCGCWDFKRKTCKPISSFRLGWENCNLSSGIHVKTDFELASAHTVGKSCKNSGSSVEIGIDATTKLFFVRITSNFCQPKIGRSGRIESSPELEAHLSVGTTKVDLSVKKIHGTVPAAILSRTSTKKLLEIFSNFGDRKNYLYQDKKIECENYSEGGSAVISMCPSFLPGNVPTFLSQHPEICGIHGECKILTPGCETTGCCLMSSGRFFSGCDCMTNSSNCLLNHKVFKLAGLSCTTSGETVKADINVRMPSDGNSKCSENESTTSSLEIALNAVGNVEISVKSKQCILSGVNNKYLEVESKVNAEVNIDQFLEVIQKLY